ncbi:E3 ubiquitin- ligase UPL3-like [Olea europaea subsp. europaea]|uniref:E3 ubiquitin- ligase UPL3-like n=1 Tax=Olea europaea subsp. europaea TaxID=158383 RepID=A0A8S0SNP8_OLEEU|nr:E3 ubiquitin- ligase UPL3-like [Olea europaea subsp. europaea]
MLCLLFLERELELLPCVVIIHVNLEAHSYYIRELWEAKTLTDYMKLDHGYTTKSPGIINLFEIMREFILEQQQIFSQFVNEASPHLPSGMAALNPKLNIQLEDKVNFEGRVMIDTFSNYLSQEHRRQQG